MGSLANDQAPGSMQRKNGLLFWGFRFDEPHRWPGNCLANSLRIGGVRFSTFHVWLDVNRSDQFHIMAQVGQFSGPIMARATSFHAYSARLQSLKEREHLWATYRTVECNFPTLGDPVNLENILG